jgi:hypothetical protein
VEGNEIAPARRQPDALPATGGRKLRIKKEELRKRKMLPVFFLNS